MVAGHAKAVDDANLQLSPRVFLFTTALECEQEEGRSGWGHCSTTSRALKNFSGSKPNELQRAGCVLCSTNAPAKEAEGSAVWSWGRAGWASKSLTEQKYGKKKKEKKKPPSDHLEFPLLHPIQSWKLLTCRWMNLFSGRNWVNVSSRVFRFFAGSFDCNLKSFRANVWRSDW